MDPSILQAFLDEMIQKGVPGCELAVCQDHRVLFHGCVGFSDGERRAPACPNDRYLMYSCSKPVTATAAMIALEQGLIRLDDPVSRFLPAYESAFVMENGRKVPVTRPLTVLNLLTMTGGLDYDLNRECIRRLMERTGGHASTVQFAESLAEEALLFEPGTRFQYSLCHDVLGAVIEVASGMPFGAFVKKRILDPLGMDDTEYWLPGKQYDRIADQYQYDSASGKVNRIPKVNELIPSTDFYSGGAGLVSTVTDYLKFADALACGESADGAILLPKARIDQMRTDQMSVLRVRDSFSCTCGEDYGYGLGVRTRVSTRIGGGALGEFGWDGAAGADILIDPSRHLSAIYAQHVLGWPDMLGAVHLEIRELLLPIA